MQSFNIVKKIEPSDSFRVKSIIGQYDLNESNYTESFSGKFDLDWDWQIGSIVGNSGTGKSTIAKEIFNDDYIDSLEYHSKSILDDMPKDR